MPGVASLRYTVSHLPELCTRHMERTGGLKGLLRVSNLRPLANLLLFVAVTVGLGARLPHAQDSAIIGALVGTAALAVIAAVLVYKLGHVTTHGPTLGYLWLGCLTGILTFIQVPPHLPWPRAELVLKILLLGSASVTLLGTLVERLRHQVSYKADFLSNWQLVESLGFIIGSLTAHGHNVYLVVLLLALVMAAGTLNAGCWSAVLNVVAILALSFFYLFPLTNVQLNLYSVSVFIFRLFVSTLFDLFFNSLTKLQRLDSILLKSTMVRFLLYVTLLAIEVTYIITLAVHIPEHKEWIIVIFIFTVAALFWLLYHLLFMLSLWKLNTRVTQCNMYYEYLEEEARSRTKILENAGVRYVGLVTERVCTASLCSTLIVGLVSWETRQALSIALFLLVWCTECLLLALVKELGNGLGGTCVGYALLVPTLSRGPGAGGPAVVPPTAVGELADRSTRIFNTVQRFFGASMIDTFACDYSTSGIAMEVLESRLKTFFDQRTTNGPKYDTYLVYYSGPATRDGDWHLSGAAESSITLSQIVRWWEEKNIQSSSRLIILCDTLFSFKWLPQVKAVDNYFVAIQTFARTFPKDLEAAQKFNIGDFTLEWMKHHTVPEASLPSDANKVVWSDRDRNTRPRYAISKPYYRFRFSEPSQQDMDDFLSENFLKLTRGLVRLSSLVPCHYLTGRWSWCPCLCNCWNNLRLKFWQPYELDSGHGFALIRA